MIQIRRAKRTQTRVLPNVSLIRFQRLSQGPSASNLYEILDILDHGYGCISSSCLYFSFDASETSLSVRNASYGSFIDLEFDLHSQLFFENLH